MDEKRGTPDLFFNDLAERVADIVFEKRRKLYEEMWVSEQSQLTRLLNNRQLECCVTCHELYGIRDDNACYCGATFCDFHVHLIRYCLKCNNCTCPECENETKCNC